MAKIRSDWALRLYDPETNKTIMYVSSFYNANRREYDNITVFEGMYGIGDYLLWKIHKDLRGMDLSGASIEVKLFIEGDKEKQFWSQKYEAVEIRYNPNKDYYLLYAITPSCAVLDTYLYEYGVNSLTFKKNRTPIEVLEGVLKENNILNVRYNEISNDLTQYEYRTLTLNRDWTVRDFINYICDENNLEWKVKKGNLFVGYELPALKKYTSSGQLTDGSDVFESAFFFKYVGDTRPMELLSHWRGEFRCIWAKHSVGASGGVSKGSFVRIAGGTVSKRQYIETLENGLERSKIPLLFQQNSYSSVGLGRIFKDSGWEMHVDEITTEQTPENLKVQTPEEMEFTEQFNTKKHATRSFAYLDNEAGIQFPSLQLESKEDRKKSPHSLIFNPKRKDSGSVVGLYVPRKGMVVPFKEKDDFRMQFPNGWVMYVDSDGNTIIQVEDADAEEKPEGNSEKMYMKFDKENKIQLNVDENTQIIMNKDGTIDINTNDKNVRINEGSKRVALKGHTHPAGGHQHTLSSGQGNFGIPLVGQDVIQQADVLGSDDNSEHSKNLRAESG